MKLDLKNVTVQLQKRDIIHDISLSASSRQFVGLIGANGSGKSTLLKTIYQVLKPTAGTIFLNEYDVVKTSPAELAQQLAVVGQFNATDFDFTVFDFIMMGRYPHKKRFEKLNHKDSVIVQDILNKMELRAYSDRRISTLSGGEKQRIIVARALVQQPQCLILDEPTNHLDIKHQLQLFSTLKKIGITTIAAVHDIAFAYNFCDKVYALKNGKVVAFGSPEHVITAQTMESVYGIKIDILKRAENKIAISYFG